MTGLQEPDTASDPSPLEVLPPRVLMILKRPGGHGGMQHQARLVSLRMRQRGVPVTLIAGQTRKKRYLPVWAHRLPVRYLPDRSQWHFARELYAYLVRCRQSYDVVHLHGFGPEVWAVLAARRVTGKPLVVKPGTSGPGTKLGLYARVSRLAPGFLPRPWSGVDTWISLSEQSRRDLLDMGVPESRIAAAPNGVDTERFRPLPPAERAALRAELGLSGPEVLVVAASRLLPHKRVDLLTRAFLHAAKDRPEARLWVLGGGPERSTLRDLVAGSPVGKQVRLWGAVQPEQMPDVLPAGDVFALFSRYEGLSNALLEAMACGLAPVVSDVSGMADVIRPGSNGLLIPPDDEAAAAKALRQLLSDPAQRESLSRAAMETVHTTYGIDRTVDLLLATYRSLIQR